MQYNMECIKLMKEWESPFHFIC